MSAALGPAELFVRRVHTPRTTHQQPARFPEASKIKIYQGAEREPPCDSSRGAQPKPISSAGRMRTKGNKYTLAALDIPSPNPRRFCTAAVEKKHTRQLPFLCILRHPTCLSRALRTVQKHRYYSPLSPPPTPQQHAAESRNIPSILYIHPNHPNIQATRPQRPQFTPLRMSPTTRAKIPTIQPRVMRTTGSLTRSAAGALSNSDCKDGSPRRPWQAAGTRQIDRKNRLVTVGRQRRPDTHILHTTRERWTACCREATGT